jgi:hypothetical protein
LGKPIERASCYSACWPEIWHRLTYSSAESQYFLAGNHALLAGLAGATGAGIAEREGDTEARRAIESLRGPLKAGYKTAGEVRADPDFSALRARTEFETLLRDAAFPKDPVAPDGRRAEPHSDERRAPSSSPRQHTHTFLGQESPSVDISLVSFDLRMSTLFLSSGLRTQLFVCYMFAHVDTVSGNG